jgi:cyclin H
MADAELVGSMLDVLYGKQSDANGVEDISMEVDGQAETNSSKQSGSRASLGRHQLEAVLDAIQATIRSVTDDFDLKKVKEVDRMLKSCKDPMRDTESALWVIWTGPVGKSLPLLNPCVAHNRRYKKRLAEHQAKAAEKRAIKLEAARKEMSKRETIFGPIVGAPHPHPGVSHMGESGMGIPAESGGMLFGGEGLLDVAMSLDSESSDSD